MPVELRTWLRRDSERAGLREEAAAPALRPRAYGCAPRPVPNRRTSVRHMVGDESNRDLVPETDEQRALREDEVEQLRREDRERVHATFERGYVSHPRPRGGRIPS